MLRKSLITLPLLLATSLTATSIDQKCSLEGITFHIISSNDSSLNNVTIKTQGLKHDTTLTKEVDGTIATQGLAMICSHGEQGGDPIPSRSMSQERESADS